jgi:transcriptional regulator with GAF, ATPase, and Fis domain
VSVHVTIAQLRDRHQREERRLLLGALERHGWSLAETARDLEITHGGIQSLVRRHGLEDLYRERVGVRGRGRPSVRSRDDKSA